MSKETAEPGAAAAHVELRRARILALAPRPQHPTRAAEPLAPDHLRFLCREAQALYWNELVWEELTDEEAIAGGHLTELVFPAFLALIDGLLLGPQAFDPGSGQRRTDAVECILGFLGQRYAALTADLETGSDSRAVVWARAMTSHLIDLVLYRLYDLSAPERERVEQSA